MLKIFGPVCRQLCRYSSILNTSSARTVSHQLQVSAMGDKFDLPSRYHGSEKSVWYV